MWEIYPLLPLPSSLFLPQAHLPFRLPLSPLLLPFLPLPVFLSSLPLAVGPLKSSEEVWGSAVCELLQRGLARNPSRNRFLCILAFKYDI